MDPQLAQAAIQGDVKSLRKALVAKPRDYFLATDKDRGNIFHIAVRGLASFASTTFINEVIQTILSKQDVQHLLSQQATLRKWNPLHMAALYGSLETVHLILGVYRMPGLAVVEQQDPAGGKPWLARANDGRTPLHLFLEYNNEEECSMEILSMDMELLCGMVDNYGNSPLCLAVKRGYSKVALKILESQYSYSVSGPSGFHPIDVMAKCSGEVWKLLYNQNPEFLHLASEDETSVLHEWAKEGILRPLLLLDETIDAYSLNNLIWLKNKWGDFPLHTAIKHDRQDFAICLSERCWIRSEPPQWQCENMCGITPLDLALNKGWEGLVLHFISIHSWSYQLVSDHRWKRWLVTASHKRMARVVEKICSFVDVQLIIDDLLSQPSTSSAQNNSVQIVLYIMSHCTEESWRLLHHKYPNIIYLTGKNGNSMLHKWAKKGLLWPLLLLEELDINSLEKLSHLGNKEGNNPLHVAVMHKNEAFALCLAEKCSHENPPIWRYENNYGITPLDLALHQNSEDLVLQCISMDCWIFHERSSKGESRLYMAVERGMDQVVQTICNNVVADTTQSVIPIENHDGRTIFHVLWNCKEMTVRLLLTTFPHLINKLDQNGNRPIDIASELGARWLTKLLISKHTSLIQDSPDVWITLCERGHLEAVEVFIKHCEDFRQLCIEKNDSPLHHIKLATHHDYEVFLAIPLIWEMKNQCDYNGKTPLHRALERRDILYAEVLLQKGGVKCNIKDKRGKTATKLLAELCDQYNEWEEMCRRVKINPSRLKNGISSITEMPTVLSATLAILSFIVASAFLYVFLTNIV